MRNLFILGTLAPLLIFVTPVERHLRGIDLRTHLILAITAAFTLVEAFLFLLYVKVRQVPAPRPVARDASVERQ